MDVRLLHLLSVGLYCSKRITPSRGGDIAEAGKWALSLTLIVEAVKRPW